MLKDYNSYLKKINEADSQPVQTTQTEQTKSDDSGIDISGIISGIGSKIKDKYKSIKNKATKLSNVKSNDGSELIKDGEIIDQPVYIVGNYNDKDQTFEIKLTSYKDGSYGFELKNKDINTSEIEFYRFDGDKLEQDRTRGRYIITNRDNKSMIIGEENNKEDKKKEEGERVQTGVQTLQDEKLKSEYTTKDISGLLAEINSKIDTYDEEKIYSEYLGLFKYIMNSTAINNDDRVKLLRNIIVKNLIEKYPSMQKIENTKIKYINDIKNGNFKEIFVDKTVQTENSGINKSITQFIEDLKSGKDKDGNELSDKYSKKMGDYILSELEKANIDNDSKAHLYKELQEVIAKNSELFAKFPSLKQIGLTADKKNKGLSNE